MKRCPWVNENNNLYVEYHDKEWGVPVYDDRVQFEFLILEGAQAGLSWETILKRRDGYSQAFFDFEPSKVANMDSSDVDRLMQDVGIIRNRLKIQSAISNAKAFLQIVEEFGSFSAYIWSFVDYATLGSALQQLSDYPSETDVSRQLSFDLKKRGFRFVGPTIMYAHMQATGLVNDHTVDCFRYDQLT